MARRLGLLNPGFAGSTISLDRRSDTSINEMENVSLDDGESENTYNTLQLNNVSRLPQKGQNPLYDVVDPNVGTQYNSRTSQTSKKPGRVKKRRGDRVIRVILMFLIVFVAVAALLLALMLMMGKIGPKCSCSTSGASPKAGKTSQQKNISEPSSPNAFNMDLTPFYDILEELKANISSLYKEAEILIMESEGNKDALVALKTALSNTEDAIDVFYNQLYSAIDHVNDTARQFDPDHGLAFNRLRAVNATIANELSELRRTYDRYNDDIDNAIDAMNRTIAQKVAVKKLDPGPTGERGQNGSKGPSGDRGPRGPVGESGTIGLKGLKGDQGAPGDNGPPGTNGPKGLQGDQGIQGLVGDEGAIGAVGDTGLQGPRGIGNFSWCQQKEKRQALQGNPAMAIVSVSDTSNTKIIGAYCTTDDNSLGTESNLQVSPSSLNEYKCVCKGPSSSVSCILYYMGCPIHAP